KDGLRDVCFPLPQQGCGDNRERLEICGGREKCHRADKKVSGFIFGRARHPARSLIWKPVPSRRARQGRTAASQMTLVGNSPHPKAFEGITWGNQDEKDSDSVG